MTTAVAPSAIAIANQRSRRLRELVRAPQILVMPGAYDTLSARLFESLGFQTIQGTSGGIAATFGLADGEVIARDDMVEVYRRMAAAVSIPVNADGEKGYGGPDEVRETVTRLVEAGIAGMNLEDGDYPRVPGEPTRLVPLEAQREKIQSFLQTKRDLGSEFFLNARVDALMTDMEPAAALREAIARGNAYAELGADCIFFPRAGNAEQIDTLVKEVSAPISVLAGAASPSIAKLEELGVARVSYGASFFLASLPGIKALAELMLAKGDPSTLLQQGYPMADLQKLLRRP